MLRSYLTQSATILEEVKSARDEYNDSIMVYSNTSGRTWRCRLWQTSQTEYELLRDTGTQLFQLILPGEADTLVNAQSRYEIDGVTYESYGEPNRVRRRARVDHIEAVVRKISG